MQKKKILLIYLNSEVFSFTIQEGHIDRLKHTLPELDIRVTRTFDEFESLMNDAQYILTWQFQRSQYEKAPLLEALFTPSAGHDWVEAHPEGKVHIYYGSFHGKIMKESLISMILYFNRVLYTAMENKKLKKWDRKPYDNTRVLCREHVLIIGFGNIGKECGFLLKQFGCKVTGLKRNVASYNDYRTVDNMISFAQLDDVLKIVDHVVFILPGGETTKCIFTREHFKTMNPASYIYNIGRGNCYKEEDLVWALKTGEIAGAGLDVFKEEPLSPDSELWTLPNVLITPHSSSISKEYLDFYLDELIAHIRNLISPGNLLNLQFF